MLPGAMVVPATGHRSLETAGYIREESDEVYVAQCPEFEVTTQGITRDDARTALIDALRQHLAFHQRRGSLREFLEARRRNATALGERVMLHVAY